MPVKIISTQKQFFTDGSFQAVYSFFDALKYFIEGTGRYSYALVFETFEFLLYHLDEHTGAEVNRVFLEEDFSECCYGRLMEVEEDGDEPTGRYLLEVHGMLPLSNC